MEQKRTEPEQIKRHPETGDHPPFKNILTSKVSLDEQIALQNQKSGLEMQLIFYSSSSLGPQNPWKMKGLNPKYIYICVITPLKMKVLSSHGCGQIKSRRSLRWHVYPVNRCCWYWSGRKETHLCLGPWWEFGGAASHRCREIRWNNGHTTRATGWYLFRYIYIYIIWINMI